MITRSARASAVRSASTTTPRSSGRFDTRRTVTPCATRERASSPLLVSVVSPTVSSVPTASSSAVTMGRATGGCNASASAMLRAYSTGWANGRCYHLRRSPEHTPIRGGRPLDPDRPNPDNARPAPEAPSGLFAQLTATRAAAIRMIRAHIDLAMAEANEIKGEVIRTLALGGLAAASLVFVAFLLLIGLILFLGEWLFGSMGWGVLLGTELLIGTAVFAVLAALRSARLGTAVAIAFALGLVVAIVFGTNVLNTIYRDIASQFAPQADPGDISFAIGAGIGALIFAIVGLFAGARGGTAGSAAGGLFAGAIAGALLGSWPPASSGSPSTPTRAR